MVVFPLTERPSYKPSIHVLSDTAYFRRWKLILYKEHLEPPTKITRNWIWYIHNWYIITGLLRANLSLAFSWMIQGHVKIGRRCLFCPSMQTVTSLPMSNHLINNIIYNFRYLFHFPCKFILCHSSHLMDVIPSPANMKTSTLNKLIW